MCGKAKKALECGLIMSVPIILITYAIAGWFYIVITLARNNISVNWFFITVPGHLYQECKVAYPVVEKKFQYIAISVDFAIFLLLLIILLTYFEII